MNEESLLESSLDLTLTQHPCDEDPEPRKVCACFKIEPPQTWYYGISLNSHTPVNLLQIDPTFDDELEIVYEGCCKIENTSIFTWSSIPSVGHHCWLCSLIC
jgi:hypothetical protein